MPRSRSRSCGSTGPSTILSPLLTSWPSCTRRCLSFAIRYSCSCLSRSVITRRCLPLVSFPKLTVPVTSASIPASFGERASKSSATRGNPPVMSRVLDTSCGMRASTSPTATGWPARPRPHRGAARGGGGHALAGGRGAALGVDHPQRGEAGHVVDLLGDGDALLDVLELHRSRVLGDDRPGGRIPAPEGLAGAAPA